MPFFSLDEVQGTGRHQSLIPRCGACGLQVGSTTPKMPLYGKGRRRILIVSEYPSKDEDEQGVSMLGQSSRRLEDALRKCGIDMERDCWRTNACLCRPSAGQTAGKDQVLACRPNLLRTIEECEPVSIILLGGPAIQSLIGYLWREDTGMFSRWPGWQIPAHQINAWVHPTYHPAYLIRMEDSVLDQLFDKHIEAAVNQTDVPWPYGAPCYLDQCKLIEDTNRAAYMLRSLIDRGGPIAFDYETNMLKPDCPDAAILSCAVCWRGKKTIAFPWHGAAVGAMGELLRSPVKKIGANIKFEERWTQMAFGHGVKNWRFCTMQAAHVLDNRPQVTSVKFQAFVLLGQPDYADVVSPYLKSKGSNLPNRIRQLDWETLLRYNALDAVLEYKIAEEQKHGFA